MSEKEDYVEVTLKVSKAIVDFFKAGQQFTKTTLSLEKWLHDRILFGLKEDISELDVGVEQVFGTHVNIEAYGLEKTFDC